MTRDIMGQDPPPQVQRDKRAPGEVRLSVRDLRRGRALLGVTLEVRAGEIVGIAGVEGNGQRELVRVVAGLDAADGGEVHGGAGAPLGTEQVVVVHEDRLAEGLVLARQRAREPDARRAGALLAPRARRLLGARSRGAPAPGTRAASRRRAWPCRRRALSGGNQQKVVVARAVCRGDRAAVLVFAQPTRGVDLGAARAIHAEIARAAEAGKAVLVVSADLAELRALCDRILVMARGRIAAELPPDAPDGRFGEVMLGARSAAGVPA